MPWPECCGRSHSACALAAAAIAAGDVLEHVLLVGRSPNSCACTRVTEPTSDPLARSPAGRQATGALLARSPPRPLAASPARCRRLPRPNGLHPALTRAPDRRFTWPGRSPGLTVSLPLPGILPAQVNGTRWVVILQEPSPRERRGAPTRVRAQRSCTFARAGLTVGRACLSWYPCGQAACPGVTRVGGPAGYRWSVPQAS